MIKELFSFHGRIRRTDYLINNLSALAVLTGWVGVEYFFSLIFGKSDILMAFFLVPGLILFGWFMIAQRIKRLHDTGNSAWLLLFSAIPYINIILDLYLLFFIGPEGDNKYGPDPRIKKVTQRSTIINVTSNVKSATSENVDNY